MHWRERVPLPCPVRPLLQPNQVLSHQWFIKHTHATHGEKIMYQVAILVWSPIQHVSCVFILPHIRSVPPMFITYTDLCIVHIQYLHQCGYGRIWLCSHYFNHLISPSSLLFFVIRCLTNTTEYKRVQMWFRYSQKQSTPIPCRSNTASSIYNPHPQYCGVLFLLFCSLYV